MLTNLVGKLKRLGVLLLLSGGFLAGCHAKALSTNVVGYNHTSRSIGHFTVNGSEGGFLGPHEGGGKFACCISIPSPWRPGLTATVGWTDENDEHYQERVVAVPQYDAKQTAQFSVHFLRSGEIKVFVTMYGLRNPNYPLQGPEASLRPDDSKTPDPLPKEKP
ncbi:DUF3304 domain-containing protein [Ralstonia chuxiongensis]|uniref:DUF3304 domain-containing protein n=1 Tax=Ralstonia chuxiongensis TaxID=2957504 RepID=UPI0028F58C5A|nr:DUF3304 domain-containing protein [Ralstonia chuxiongensis]CAJ0772635.1 hypothetical protein R8510_02821 [Ralstonia chuxiongensis]